MCCIICGEEKTKKYQLPYGVIELCPSSTCTDQLNFKMNESVPVVWMSLDDIEDDDNLNSKVIEWLKTHPEYLINSASSFQSIWDSWSFGDTYHDGIRDASTWIEEQYVQNIKEEDLPLISMDDLEFEGSKELLEQRLKGQTNPE